MIKTLNLVFKSTLLMLIFSIWLVIFVRLFCPSLSAQTTPPSTADFDQEAESLYRALGNTEITREAFLNAYTAYYSLRGEGKVSGSPVITFVNFTIPSNKTRLFVIDLNSKTIIFSSKVAHGKNSGGVASPATNFSNTDNSLQSSLGYYVTGETYSGKHGQSLRLDGLSSGLNTNARNRDIVIHAASYVDDGGRSFGCLALPPQNTTKAIELLKNHTLIFTFTNSQLAKLGDKNSATMASTNKDFSALPNVESVPPEFPEYSSMTELSTAASSVGELGPSSGVTLLQGSNKYTECQNLSNKSWADTVTGIASGINPSSFFTGSWTQLKKQIVTNEVENEDAVNLSKQRLSDINDCVAIAHISTETDFTKKEINSPETKISADGKIKCSYNTPESQDYKTCLKSISVYEDISSQEKTLHKNQESNLIKENTDSLRDLNITNAQDATLGLSQKSSNTLSTLTAERADISNSKINALSAIASKIPTKEMLFDKCQDSFKKHGLVSTNEFNSFVKLFSSKEVVFEDSSNHCINAVSTKVNPIQNEVARSQIKEVLKSYGSELKDYESKSEGFKNQLTGQINSGSSLYLENIKFNENNSYLDSTLSEIDKRLTSKDFVNDNSPGGSDLFFTTTNSIDIGNHEMNRNLQTNHQVINLQNENESSVSSNHNTENQRQGNGVVNQNGIYDPIFYEKINKALTNPELLSSLNLSPTQMKEYLDQKKYLESINVREPSSSNMKKQDSFNFHNKEQNIFEIISKKYQEVFHED